MKKAAITIALSVLLALLSANVNTVAHAQGDLVAPSSVAAQNTGNPGEVRISWDAVPNAAYYRIGWVAYSDVEPIIASGGDWLERFAFIDIQNRSQTQHTITRLTPGVQYAFIVASNDGRYGAPRWPTATGWQYLTLTGAPASQASIGTASVNITWDAVPGAAYYRIGWVVYSDVEPIIAAGGDWLEHFAFIDIANRNQAEHTITRLTPGLQYAFIVAGNDGRYGTPQWPDASGWQFITPGAGMPPLDQPVCPPLDWTVAARPVATVSGDYDADDDGLIEVSNLEQLDAIRYDTDGNGESRELTYRRAFFRPLPGMGCPDTGCTGFELVADLDFDTNRNGVTDAGDAYWNDGDGWESIPNLAEGVTFDGGGHTISNLNTIATNTYPVASGLFDKSSGTIKNLGLIDFIAGTSGMVWQNRGTIADSYVTGTTTPFGETTNGGLVAGNQGTINDSCASVSLSRGPYTGGLVGNNVGTINDSFATGTLSGGGGGLVGQNRGTINNSFATTTVSGRSGGGLVFSNWGTINNSHASGAVSLESGGGGLVDRNVGTIVDSYATGTVSGRLAGGLAASNSTRGTIRGSYATGAVSGITAGGLIGQNSGDVQSSFAVGAVTGGKATGGLVGRNERNGAITASYARGAVTGNGTDAEDASGGLAGWNEGAVVASYATGHTSIHQAADLDAVGGLVGRNTADGMIVASYSIGRVSAQGGIRFVGGMIGVNVDGTVADSYWDTQTSGQSYSADGIGGKTTVELRSSLGYAGIYANWDVDVDNADGDDDLATGGDDPWDFGTSSQYPVLKYGGLDPAQQRR